MKFIHLSDLHLGKRVNEFPMIEDQAYILEQILAVIDQQTPDAGMFTTAPYHLPKQLHCWMISW